MPLSHLNRNAPYRAILAHAEPPRLDYAATLLGQPLFSLHAAVRSDEVVSAVAQEHPNVVVIEPRQSDGDATNLASDLMNTQRLNMPNILRVGEAAELQSAWPFHPHTFDLSQGADAFNKKLISLLSLRHIRLRHHVVRLNPVNLGVTVIVGHAAHFSTRGMLFASPKRINLNSDVLLEITGIPEFAGVRISGTVQRQQVVSSSMPHYAVQFTDLTPDVVSKLAHFLADDCGGLLPRPADLF